MRLDVATRTVWYSSIPLVWHSPIRKYLRAGQVDRHIEHRAQIPSIGHIARTGVDLRHAAIEDDQ
jgi:hypothetical protein